MESSTEKARKTARRELRSEPLESVIDRMIAECAEKGGPALERDRYFEIPDKMVMFYRYSYGMQSRFFRELMDNALLYGTKCSGCGIVHFPPRSMCSECHSGTSWVKVSERGTVLSGTVSWYATSEFFDRVPYAVAYVKPADADTAILQRIDLRGRENVEPGTPVIAKFKEAGMRRGMVSDFWYEIVM